MKRLWTEKYRPTKVEDYVFRDEKQKNQVINWIKEGAIPHLLLSGTQGIGKTTLALLLMKELGVTSEDILKLNASSETGIDSIRDNVGRFAQQMPYNSEFRYILLDEADYLSHSSQGALRGYLEEFASSARFILTCNFVHKISSPLKSRCQGFHLEKLDRGEFDTRVASILVSEGVDFDIDTMDTYVKATYPDLRKCINSLQQNTIDGILKLPDEEDVSGNSEYMIEMVNLFKQGKINEARKLVCAQARPDDMENIYKFLYQNLEFWGDEQNQENAILIIKDGLVNHAICADSEINLAATLIQLSHLLKK